MTLNLPPEDSSQVVAFCINLDRRPDRWASAQEQWRKFSDLPGNLLRVKAVDTGSLVGCGQSHQLCVDHAKRKQMPWILVLEDDVVFAENSKSLWAEQVQALAKHAICDIFRPGLSSVNNATRIKPPLYQFRDASGLFMTLYFESSYDTVLRWSPGDGHIDRWLSWQSSLTNLTAVPFIASTLDGQSDIRNRQVEDSNIISRTQKQLENLESTVARDRAPGVLPAQPAPVPYVQLKPTLMEGPRVLPGQRVPFVSRKGTVSLGATVRTSDGRILRQINHS